MRELRGGAQTIGRSRRLALDLTADVVLPGRDHDASTRRHPTRSGHNVSPAQHDRGRLSPVRHLISVRKRTAPHGLRARDFGPQMGHTSSLSQAGPGHSTPGRHQVRFDGYKLHGFASRGFDRASIARSSRLRSSTSMSINSAGTANVRRPADDFGSPNPTAPPCDPAPRSRSRPESGP